MRISAKVDYAVRAAIELARNADGEERKPTKGDRVARAQAIPLKFLENILIDLRHAGLVRSQRGAEGGYWLARPATEISVADIVRAVEGPLASVRGETPENIDYPEGAEQLQRVWIALRTNIRSVLENVSLADLAADKLPPKVAKIADDPSGWTTR